MKETTVMQSIMLALSKAGATIFRNNVAQAWVGKIINQTPTTITLLNPRPLHAGLVKGSSDIIGWKTIEITPDMVGKKVAVFTAVEVKADKGRTSPEQINFIDNLMAAGGYAGVAKSADEALKIIGK